MYSSKVGVEKVSAEQSSELHARVPGPHESLADEEGADAPGAHPRDVGVRQDSRFGDDDPVLRNARQLAQRGIETDGERAKDAVVDSDKRPVLLQ